MTPLTLFTLLLLGELGFCKYVLILSELNENDVVTVSKDWTIKGSSSTSNTAVCSNQSFFGGPAIFGETTVIERWIYLPTDPPTPIVNISFLLGKFDKWNYDEPFSVTIDKAQSKFLFSETDGQNNKCGDPLYNDGFFLENISLNISTKAFLLKFSDAFTALRSKQSWGIRDLKIYVSQGCPLYNQFINSSFKCQCPERFYSTENEVLCLPCSSLCKTCQNAPSECLSCDPDFDLVSSTCIAKSGVTSVISNELTSFGGAEISSWQVNGNFSASFNSTCKLNIFGGFSIFGPNTEVSKNFNSLPPHWKIMVRVFIVKIDDWGANTDYKYLSMSIDSKIIYKERFTGTNDFYIGDLCGDTNFNEDLRYSSFSQNHNSDTLRLSFQGDPDTNLKAYWGIKNLLVYASLCESTCAHCLDSASYCTACRSSNSVAYNGTCLQSCPEKTYEYLENGFRKCKDCNTNCNSCSKISTNCTSCASNLYFYQNDCLTSCQAPMVGSDFKCVDKCKLPNEYPDPIKRDCRLCSSDCKTCESDPNTCTSCETPLFLDPALSKCINTCPLNFWGVPQTRTCTKNCFSENEYKDQTDRICKPCDITCKSCTDPFSCLSCVTNTFLTSDSKCKDRCEAPKFANNQTNTCEDSCLAPNQIPNSGRYCQQCDTRCATCFGPTFNDCVKCNSDFYFYCVSSCLDKCPDNFFGTIEKLCELCSEGCRLCRDGGLSSCTSCQATYYLVDGSSCQKDCPNGFFPNKLTNVCETCHQYCNICNGPTSNECQSCQQGIFKLGNSCYQSCPAGYIDTIATSTCGPCDSNCATCKSIPENCLSCNSGMFLLSNNCVKNCLSSYYEDKVKNICASCHQKCVRCFGSEVTQCLECVNSFFLDDQTCTEKCPLGKVPDLEKNICISCHKACKTCKGPTETDCLSCITGNFLISWKSICVDKCPSGLYDDIEQASCIRKCHYSCKDLKCSSYDQSMCNECVDGFIFSFVGRDENGTSYGSCRCSSGYYSVAPILINNPQCMRCNSNCKECSGPDEANCTSCFDFKFILNGTCKCPIGYPDKGICKDCHQSCFNCTGPTEHDCSFCYPPNEKQSDGSCRCPEGKFVIYNGLCSECHYSCATCSGIEDYNCLTCPKQRRFVPETNQCLCPDYTIDPNCTETIFFDICSVGCHSCYNPKNCINCTTNYFLKNDNSCGCFQGNYSDIDGCKACHYSCGDCSGKGSRDCLTICSSNTRDSIIEGECPCKDEFEEVFSRDCREKTGFQVFAQGFHSVVARIAGVTIFVSAVSGGAGLGGASILGILEISQIISLSEYLRIEFPLSLDKAYLNPISSLRLDEFFPEESTKKNNSNRILETSPVDEKSMTRVRNIVFTLGLQILTLLPILLLIVFSKITRSFTLKRFLLRILALIRWRLLMCMTRLLFIAQILFVLSELKNGSKGAFLGLSNTSWTVFLSIFHVFYLFFLFCVINGRNFDNADVKERHGSLIDGVDNIFFLKRNYAFFCHIRKLILCFIFVFLSNSPNLLTLLLILFQILFLVYIIMSRPFLNPKVLLITILFEVSLFIYFIILAFLVQNETVQSRINTAWGVIVITILIHLSMTVVALYNMFLIVRKFLSKSEDDNEDLRKNSKKLNLIAEIRLKQEIRRHQYNLNESGLNSLNHGDGTSYNSNSIKRIPSKSYQTFVIKEDEFERRNDSKQSEEISQRNDGNSNDSPRSGFSHRLNESSQRKSLIEKKKGKKSSLSLRRDSDSTKVKQIKDEKKDVQKSPKLEAFGDTPGKGTPKQAKDLKTQNSNSGSPVKPDQIENLIQEETKKRNSKEELDKFHRKIELVEIIPEPEPEQEFYRKLPCQAVLVEKTVVKGNNGAFYLDQGSFVTVCKIVFEVGLAEIKSQRGSGMIDLECLELQQEEPNVNE